jgi:hypothetical protein
MTSKLHEISFEKIQSRGIARAYTPPPQTIDQQHPHNASDGYNRNLEEANLSAITYSSIILLTHNNRQHAAFY